MLRLHNYQEYNAAMQKMHVETLRQALDFEMFIANGDWLACDLAYFRQNALQDT